MGEGLETSLPGRDALEEGKPDIQGQNSPSNSEPQRRGFWKPVDRTGEGTPSGPPSDSPGELEDSLPLPTSKSGLLESCPRGLFLLSPRQKKTTSQCPPRAPRGGGLCRELCGRHVQSAQRGPADLSLCPQWPSPIQGWVRPGPGREGVIWDDPARASTRGWGATVTVLVSKEHVESLRACLV